MQNICFSLQYSPLATDIKKIILKHWHVILNIPGCSEKLFIGMWKARAIKDILVHTNLKKEHLEGTSTAGHYRCKNCGACKLSLEGRTFVHPLTGQEYVNRQLTSCTSKYCVYVILCGCLMMYVVSEV